MRIILWDVDGTLVDSAQLHKEKIIAIAANPLGENIPAVSPLGVAVSDADWDNTLYGKADRLVYKWIKEKNPAYPLDLEQFIEKTEAYFAAHASSLKPRKGALEAFNKFSAKGYYQVAVSSGTRAGINASLATIGILDKLAFTIAEGDTQKSKPDPEPYEVAFARMIDLLKKENKPLPDKSESLVIEDSKGGAEAGGRSGIPTVYWKQNPAARFSPFATYNLVSAKALETLADSVIARPEGLRKISLKIHAL